MALSPALADKRSYDFLMASLSERQRLYVAARAKGATPIAAANSASYADPVAAAEKNEKDPMIRTALEYSLKMQARETTITREDVIAGLMDAVHMAATATEMVAAWREIGKLVGAYEPIKVEHTHTVSKERVAEMSDDELLELAAIDAEYVVLSDESPGS